MKVLIDTNIIVDAATDRAPFGESSLMILNLCGNGSIEGFISSRAFCDLFYILRKGRSAEERKDMIRSLRGYLKTVIITDPIIDSALNNNNITDFEDAIQYACAESVGADYIVTRNVKDYGRSSIKAITPEKLMKLM